MSEGVLSRDREGSRYEIAASRSVGASEPLAVGERAATRHARLFARNQDRPQGIQAHCNGPVHAKDLPIKV